MPGACQVVIHGRDAIHIMRGARGGPASTTSRSPSVSWRLIGDPQRFIDDAVEFRQFCCPACGGLIEDEVCRAQDPVLHDMELEGE